jgi:uncharacterized protein YkwD
MPFCSLSEAKGMVINMNKKLVKTLAVLGISALLTSQLFVQEAYASWGAARLRDLQGTTTAQPAPSTPTSPTTPSTGSTTSATQGTPTVTTPATTPSSPAAPSPVEQGSMNAEEQLMLKLINEERSKNGLRPLAPMAKLNELARLKSIDIIKKNYFSHTSPTYGSFAKMVYDAGIRFRSVGENLAKARNAQHAFTLLMASSGHRANILNPNFTHVGLGVVPDRYGVVVTQLFIMQ